MQTIKRTAAIFLVLMLVLWIIITVILIWQLFQLRKVFP